MSQQILQVDQAMLETTLDRMVRKSVEETLNAMPATSGAWCTSNATSSPGSPPQPRGQTAHARGRQLPGRAQRVDAHLRTRALCHVERVVDAPLPRHVKAR